MSPLRRTAPLGAVLFFIASGTTLATPVTTTIDFDSPATSPAMVPLHGNKIEGSTATVSTDAFHSGTSSLKLDFVFAGVATFEEMPASFPVIATGDGTLKFSMWVKGAGGPALQSGAIRLIDSKGELFQYQIKGLPEAFNGNEWTNVTADIDLMKYSSTWGPNTDGQVKYPLKFFAIVGDHVKQTLNTATILIDDISFTSEVIPRPELGKLAADRELLLANPGDKVSFTANIRNPETARGPLAATWLAKDVDGNVLDQTTSPVTESATAYIFKPAAPGWAGVECQLKDDRGPIGPPSTSAIATIDNPGSVHGPNDPFYFGVCAHMLNYAPAENDRDIALMKAAGFGACRVDFVWQILQPAEDKLNWSRTDDLVAKMLAAGINPCPNLGYSARWASTGPASPKTFQDWAFAPPVREKFDGFVKSAVERYKGKIRHWEVWNEPDLGFWRGTVDQYGDLLGSSVAAAHEVDPDARVMNGGISERFEFKPDFTPGFLARANPKPDVFAYHSHGPLENLYVASAKVREILKTSGMEKTPVWLNEAGMSSCKGWGTEKDKASTLVKKMATSQALGDRAFMLYDLRNDGENPTDPEANYGIVKRDFTPLPAFVTVHTLVAALSGKAYAGALNLGPGATAYAFTGAGDTVVVAWTSARSATVSGLLRANVKSAQLSDMMGRVQTVPAPGGVFPLTVAYDPVLLTFSGQKSPVTALDSPLDCASVAGYSGPTGTLAVTVKNPLTKKLEATLEVQGTGVTVVQNSTSLEIAPGASQTLNIAFAISGQPNGKRTLNLTLASLGLPKIVREVPCLPALVLPVVPGSDSPWSTVPTATLQVPQNAVILFGATYEEALKLRPGNDLAANVWLRSTPAGIQLRVDVTDDVQFQDSSGSEMWKGDSVQLALSTTSGHNYEWVAGLTAGGPTIARTQWPKTTSEPATGESVKITRTGAGLRYDILIPASIEDIAQAMRDGCMISLLVNDNDGKGRKGWVEWTPGIGVRKDPAQYKRVLFQPSP